MSSPSKGQHSQSTETPIREDRYMGFRFIEYADRYDFQLAGASSRLSRSLGGFTLLVLGGLVTIGLLVSVHVKAPISGQMEARHPQFVPARFKGKILKVEVRNKQTVKAGQLLLMVDAAEQEKHVSRLKNQLSSAKEAVEKADEEIRSMEKRKKQAENQLLSLKDGRKDIERNLVQRKQQYELSVKELEEQEKATENTVENARLAITRIRDQIESRQSKKKSEIERLELSIDQAKLKLDNKKKAYESDQRLLANGVISRGQLDESKTAYDLAGNDLESARSNLQGTMVDLDSQVVSLQNDLGTAENNYRTKEGEMRGIVLSRKKGEFQYEKDKASIGDQLRKKDFDIRSADLEIETNSSSIKRAISSKAITENQVEDARSELKKAEKDLREGTRIVAPSDGFVEEVLMQEGQEATPGQPVIRMASQELEFVGLIASRYRERVKKGQKVKIEFEEFQKGAGDDIEHQGEVVQMTDEKIKSQGGVAGKMYKVKVRIDRPKAEKHRGQMPSIGYSGGGNVLTQEMSLLKYWIFHKLFKKV